MAPVCTLGSTRGARLPSSRRLLRGLIAGLTGAALFASVAGDANAYVVKRTSKGELVHWEKRSIDYTVDSSIDDNVEHATDAIVRSMDSWSGAVGAPDLTAHAPNESSPRKPGFDEKNGIFFVKGGYAPAGRALAITVLTYDNGTGRILDSDVIFNGSYAFQVLDAPGDLSKHEASTHLSNTDDIVHEDEASVEQLSDTYDLHHVVAHELGHALGMNDEMAKRDALMYRYSAPNDATIREPASDDIAGLAELYSTELEAKDSGCGGATIAPKKPSNTAAHGAMFVTVGLLAFLVLRAKRDRRARLGFVLAVSGATIAFVPTLSGSKGVASAANAEHATQGLMLGHARAHVLSSSTAIEDGLFKTTYELGTVDCRAASCPKTSHGVAWGGTIGKITQEVGNQYAPRPGETVDVSFKKLPSAIGSLMKPLAGRIASDSAEVRVVTRAHADR